jgi:hypothetical protein
MILVTAVVPVFTPVTSHVVPVGTSVAADVDDAQGVEPATPEPVNVVFAPLQISTLPDMVGVGLTVIFTSNATPVQPPNAKMAVGVTEKVCDPEFDNGPNVKPVVPLPPAPDQAYVVPGGITLGLVVSNVGVAKEPLQAGTATGIVTTFGVGFTTTVMVNDAPVHEPIFGITV